jgi:hypothetical protein
MISSTVPTLVPVPFASGAGTGFINPIPIASQIVGSSDPGLASMTDGFTPRTFTPEGSGGLPPRGQDFNGILNLHSTSIQWAQLGKGYAYNAGFQTAIGGYPKGAVLVRSDLTGGWISTAENNMTNPEALGAGWLPYAGSTSPLSIALTNASVTLTALQAASNLIMLTGTLSANVNIVLPAWVGSQWLIINNTSAGAFTVTAKTASGTGVKVVGNTDVYCGSAGINSALPPGTLVAIRTINASGNYVPTPGARNADVTISAGGGGGGGAAATSSSTCSAATGGGSGAYARAWIPLTQTSYAVVIGVPGSLPAGANGGDGGVSSFGSLISCPGGSGGNVGNALAAPFFTAPTQATTFATINAPAVPIENQATGGGESGIALGIGPGQSAGGRGGTNPMSTRNGLFSTGAGGVGAAQGQGNAAAIAGFPGGGGTCIIVEYS